MLSQKQFAHLYKPHLNSDLKQEMNVNIKTDRFKFDGMALLI